MYSCNSYFIHFECEHIPCRASDEHHKTVQPDGIVDNLAEFVDALLQHQPHPHK